MAPDLPCDDDAAGLPEYADAVVDAIGDRTGLVVVAQSFGGFTAPLVCDRVDVDLLVLVAASALGPRRWCRARRTRPWARTPRSPVSRLALHDGPEPSHRPVRRDQHSVARRSAPAGVHRHRLHGFPCREISAGSRLAMSFAPRGRRGEVA